MRRTNRARPNFDALSVAAWAAQANAVLALPAEHLAARLQEIADRLHQAVTAARLPAPKEHLEWALEAERRLRDVERVLGPPGDVADLAPLAPDDLASVARLRAAISAARVAALARVVATGPGRPDTGRQRARAELAQIGKECFAPSLKGRALAAFVRWFFASGNRGNLAPDTDCAGSGNVSA